MRVLAMALLVLAGCGSSRSRIELVIDTEVGVPSELDELFVTVTASRTPEGRFCEPAARHFNLDPDVTGDQAELPVRVTIVRGSTYSRWAAARIVGSSSGAPVFLREYRLTWPVSGTSEVDVTFESACHQFPCGDNEQCVAGMCQGVPAPGIFDDPDLRDPGVSCDRAAVVDAGP